jgi:hypothetical protein
MKRFRVDATLQVGVSTIVELSDEEAKGLEHIQENIDLSGYVEDHVIRERAMEQFNVSGYVGNGGLDKLIGVVGRNNTIYCNDMESLEIVDIDPIY